MAGPQGGVGEPQGGGSPQHPLKHRAGQALVAEGPLPELGQYRADQAQGQLNGSES